MPDGSASEARNDARYRESARWIDRGAGAIDRADAPGVAGAPLLVADGAKLPAMGGAIFLAYHSGELALDNDAGVKMRATFCEIA